MILWGKMIFSLKDDPIFSICLKGKGGKNGAWPGGWVLFQYNDKCGMQLEV